MEQDQDNKEVSIDIIPDTAYNQDRAQIDSMISTANAYPRSLKKATSNAIALSTMSMETAKACHYALPRADKKIQGPSINLAKILAQCYGNMRCEAKVIAIEPTVVVSQAIAFDLENNLAIKVEVRRSIMTKTGRMNNDMITVTGNAANAIALRNAIFAVLPRGYVDTVYNAVKTMITGDLSDANKLLIRRKQVVDALKESYEVSDKEILTACGRASMEHINADDLVILIGIGTAIKEGDTTVDEAFGRNKKSKPIGKDVLK